jgi:hypothetical protein
MHLPTLQSTQCPPCQLPTVPEPGKLGVDHGCVVANPPRFVATCRRWPRHGNISPGPFPVCGTIAAVDMAPEIVTNAIIAALSAGAVAGTTDTAKSAIADGYQGLKSLIKKKFGDHSGVAKAIDNLEEKPDSGGRRQTVLEELQAVNSSLTLNWSPPPSPFSS